MRIFLSLVAAVLVWVVLPGQALAQKKARNVVLIIADDMGLDAGCYGHKVVKTPNLDQLAKKGIRFTQAHCTTASCSASRASIFTGMFTHQNGQFGHAHLPHGFNTFPWVESLPALLRAAGHYTGLIGKFHVAPDGSYPFHELIVKGIKGNRDPAGLAKKTQLFIDNAQKQKQPFFLVVASADPHRSKDGFGNELFPDDAAEVKYAPKEVVVPYYLPDQPEVRKELAEYYQAISRFDRAVGLVLEVLRETGQLDDTLILVISDNGMPFPGAKTTVYDPGVHLPLIVAAPGHKQGHVNNAMVSYIDLAPTILDWAGAKGPAKYKLPGRSFLPILDESEPKGWDAVFGSHQFHEVTMYYPMRFLKTRQHKLIINLAHKQDFPFASDLWASDTWQGIWKRKDKLMGQRSVDAYLHRPLQELYDWTKDPNELKNLVKDNAHAEKLAELRKQIVSWQKATNDPWAILYQQGLELGKEND